jgi:hypothetical protein
MSVRSYTYIQAIVKAGAARRAVESMKAIQVASAAFDKQYEKELTQAWSIVETKASSGSIRLFLKDYPVFQNKEIQLYFARKGFSFSESTMDWWHTNEEKEMQ